MWTLEGVSNNLKEVTVGNQQNEAKCILLRPAISVMIGSVDGLSEDCSVVEK